MMTRLTQDVLLGRRPLHHVCRLVAVARCLRTGVIYGGVRVRIRVYMGLSRMLLMMVAFLRMLRMLVMMTAFLLARTCLRMCFLRVR